MKRDTMELQVRPLLNSGMLAKAEDGAWVMLIDSEQPKAEQAQAVFHELLHVLLLFGGVPSWLHCEPRIEAMAKRLAEAAPDVVDLLPTPYAPRAGAWVAPVKRLTR